MSTKHIPHHTHDCDKCVFQGHYANGDWYICDDIDGTILKRHSSDGPDYWSMPISMVKSDRYIVAASNMEGVYKPSMELAEARAVLLTYQLNNPGEH